MGLRGRRGLLVSEWIAANGGANGRVMHHGIQ